jgi:4a-hydroxytetrahydrobiopterin dehydratase
VPTSDAAAAQGGAAHPWRRRERPLRLERRLVFGGYEALRAFLDRAGDLSDETGIFPNLSFGRTYVNMTLFADEASGEITAEAEGFAQRIDGLVETPREQ